MARAYELYLLCRNQQLMHVELPKGKKTQHIITTWTTGLDHFPWPGAAIDQPHATMDFFEQFIRGDQTAAQRKLSK